MLLLVGLAPRLATAQNVRLENIQFKGNKRVSARKLNKAIHSQANPWYRVFMPWVDSKIFDESTFLTDLLRVEKYYQREGYLQAKVVNYEVNYNTARDEANLVIEVEEGTATKVRDVTFLLHADSSRGLTAGKLVRVMKLKPGKRYREDDLHLDYDKIVQRFGDNGYPYIRARVKPTIDAGEHAVDLEWRLEPGPLSYFGDIRYVGNNHVSGKVIHRGLGFSTGEVYQQKKLVNAQSQVYRLELFQFVSLQASQLDQQVVQVPIEVRVRETSLRTLKLGLGYGSEEKFRGFAQWRHRNFLGGARILRVSARHSTRLNPLTLEFELSQPYFLSNRNDLIVKPFLEWRDESSFEERKIGAETTLNRRLSSKMNIFFTTLVERDSVRSKGVGVAPRATGSYNQSKFRLGIRHDSSDQIFTPTRGQISSAYIEESGRLLRTPFRYIKFFSEHRFYNQTKNKKYVIAAKVAIGVMKPFRGSPETPLADRFFAGGAYSVRGWGRQLLGPLTRSVSDSTVVPQGGNSLFEGSLEIRRGLYKQLSGALFLDYGNVWPDWNGIRIRDLRYAIGAGLRFDTLIGPIRVDVARKLNKQALDGGDLELHLSIGQAF